MRAKAKLLLIALAAILVTVLTQPMLAYYTTVGKATNVVTSGDISLQIHEKTASGDDFPAQGVYIIPGDVVSKQVSVENICTHPFYLRLQLVSGSTNEELSPQDCMALNINRENWTEKDGYYYYNEVLQPGQTTVPVFTEVQIVGEKVLTSHIGTTLSLTVNAYAVQSENNAAAAPWEASGWPKN